MFNLSKNYSIFIFLLFSISLLIGSSCEKEQEKYNAVANQVEGTWKIDKITTADNVYNNIGFITFPNCEIGPDNRTCDGTAIDSLGLSYTTRVEFQAGKLYDEPLITVSTTSTTTPLHPFSLLVGGNQFIIGETINNKMVWLPSGGGAFPKIELEKQ